MTFDSTLDLLYLVIAISVLWVSAMLTWLLFEVASAAHRTNHIIKTVHDKVLWLEKTIAGIGERLESSASYMKTFAQGGKMVADFIRERRVSREEDEEDEPPRKNRRRA